MITGITQSGQLNAKQLQKIVLLTREVKTRTAIQLSLLDQDLFVKLARILRQLGDSKNLQVLSEVQKELKIDGVSKVHGRVVVENYRKYGMKVKYFDRVAA